MKEIVGYMLIECATDEILGVGESVEYLEKTIKQIRENQIQYVNLAIVKVITIPEIKQTKRINIAIY